MIVFLSLNNKLLVVGQEILFFSVFVILYSCFRMKYLMFQNVRMIDMKTRKWRWFICSFEKVMCVSNLQIRRWLFKIYGLKTKEDAEY